MNKVVAAVFVVFLVSIGLQAQETKFRKAKTHLKNSYIVVFNDNPEGFDAKSLTAELNSQYRGKVEHIFDYVLKGYSAKMSAESAQILAQDPRIAYVEEDAIFYINQTTQPNPPVGLDRIDQRDLPLNQLFTYYADGSNVNAYIVDSGLYVDHADFGGRAAIAYDALNDGQNGNDCNGHGTAVAGVVGGATYGVAKNVQLRGVRVANCSGSAASSDIISGLDWIKNNRANPAVVNISLGDGGINSSLDNAVNDLVLSGVTVVVAAGNLNQNACNHSIARAANAITVAGSSQGDYRLGGKGWASNFGGCVDLFAPGELIETAFIGSPTAVTIGSGTSFSSPHVAGFVAQYLSRYAGDSPSDVAAALQIFATQNRINNVGSGSPNLLLYSNLKLASSSTIASSNYSGCAYTPVVAAGDGRFAGSFAAGQGANPSLHIEKEINGSFATVASYYGYNFRHFNTAGNYRMRACAGSGGGYGWFIAQFSYATQ